MKEIVQKLIKLNKTISTMESCTGGYIVNEITNIEGSSDVLKFSAITYSNEYKIKLGVEKDIIDKYSVYSIETAHDMSKKIALYTNSNYGIGITGQLNRVDKNNLVGSNNKVYISIYNKDNDKFYDSVIEVNKKERTENKKQVLEEVKKLLGSII